MEAEKAEHLEASAKVKEIQEPLKEHLENIIRCINRNDVQSVYFFCNVFAGYLKEQFPKHQEEAKLIELMKLIHIDCAVSFSNIEFLEPLLDALSTVKKDYQEQIVDVVDDSAKVLDIQQQMAYVRHALIGLNACIVMTSDIEEYKIHADFFCQDLDAHEENKFKHEIFVKQIKGLVLDLNQTMQMIRRLDAQPEVLKQKGKEFIDALQIYQKSLPNPDIQTPAQALKYQAVGTAIQELSAPNLTAHKMVYIFSNLDDRNKEAEKLTRKFFRWIKSLFSLSSNRLDHIVSDFKKKLLAIEQESEKSPENRASNNYSNY